MTWGSSSSSEGKVTVEYLLQRRVRLDWQEAVAIALETAVVMERERRRSVPTQANVVLTPTGSIDLSRGRSLSGSSVSALTQMLGALLPSEHPTQLRLIVSTAGPNSSAYKDLSELSEALKYFERPGRRNMLVEVHGRALKTPMPVDASPKKAEVKKAQAKKRPGRIRRSLAPLAGATAVFAVIAAGVLFVEYRNPGVVSGPAEDLSGEATAAWDMVRENATEDLAGLVERVKEVDSELRREEKPEADAATEPTERSSSVSTLPRAVGKTSRFGPSALSARLVSTSSTGTPSMPEPDPLLIDVVFDTTDTTVAPPVVHNRSFPELPAGRYVTRRNVNGLVEAVVSANGQVESAKLIEPPHTIHESMILSAIKTWQFEPAMKDGRPVRYRELIPVAVP